MISYYGSDLWFQMTALRMCMHTLATRRQILTRAAIRGTVGCWTTISMATRRKLVKEVTTTRTTRTKILTRSGTCWQWRINYYRSTKKEKSRTIHWRLLPVEEVFKKGSRLALEGGCQKCRIKIIIQDQTTRPNKVTSRNTSPRSRL